MNEFMNDSVYTWWLSTLKILRSDPHTNSRRKLHNYISARTHARTYAHKDIMMHLYVKRSIIKQYNQFYRYI